MRKRPGFEAIKRKVLLFSPMRGRPGYEAIQKESTILFFIFTNAEKAWVRAIQMENTVLFLIFTNAEKAWVCSNKKGKYCSFYECGESLGSRLVYCS